MVHVWTIGLRRSLARSFPAVKTPAYGVWVAASLTPAVTPVRAGNVFEETMERLLQLLRLGQFPPGAKLPPERALAEMLAVSRTTLREALAELGDAGYVQVRRGRYGGTYVAEVLPAADPGEVTAPTPAEVQDLLTFRAVVEPAATRLAAQREIGVAAGQELLMLHRQVLAAPAEQFRPLDSRFHLAVAELSGSPSLVAAVAECRSRLNALLDQIPLLVPNLAHSGCQHEQVVTAVLDGNPDAAHRAAVDHLEGTAALLRGFLA